jgi:predicted dienelactone hydrolase
MSRFNKSLPVLITALLLTQNAAAFQAGWRQISIAGPRPDVPATTVALYYPTQTLAGAVPMGPFTPHVAPGAAPEPSVKGLIVLSHGTGGSELGYSRLAEGLAQEGYLVAALRHPRDNWQDQSLLKDSPETYFTERPRQVSWVIDALLRDPQWKDRIARDARGPKVGAVGHSAGGYTVLALAGGQPDVMRIAKHCDAERAADPIFCGMGRDGRTLTQPAAPPAACARSWRWLPRAWYSRQSRLPRSDSRWPFTKPKKTAGWCRAFTPNGLPRTCREPKCIECPTPGTSHSWTRPAWPFPHRTVTPGQTLRGFTAQCS